MNQHCLIITLGLLVAAAAGAQTTPKVSPMAYYTDSKGVEQHSQSISSEDGEAPLTVIFRANPENMENHTPHYEWHFVKDATTTEAAYEMMVRYEEDTEYTFTESGSYTITLNTTLTDQESDLDPQSITVTISESSLDFPNAFSPNEDGFNDTFHAKDGWKSIVEFRAVIINRWGQKLYEWNDPSGGWDGTYNGHPVKEGVYFLVVKARGADGREYNIRRDVNLLRTHSEGGTSAGSR